MVFLLKRTLSCSDEDEEWWYYCLANRPRSLMRCFTVYWWRTLLRYCVSISICGYRDNIRFTLVSSWYNTFTFDISWMAIRAAVRYVEVAPLAANVRKNNFVSGFSNNPILINPRTLWHARGKCRECKCRKLLHLPAINVVNFYYQPSCNHELLNLPT